MDIKQIKDCIKADKYEMSQHALERALERDVWKEDIEHAIIHGEIIEEYEEDKPYPSCLIYGKERRSYPYSLCFFTDYPGDNYLSSR